MRPEIPKIIGGISKALFVEELPDHKVYKSLKARADSKRTRAEKIADIVTKASGTFSFLALNVIVFIVWILINVGHIPSIPQFDPFPFQFLTMAVSLEAIILSILVLISQNRAGKIDDLREEIHLQVNLIAEKEITKVIGILIKMAAAQGIDLTKDKELEQMLKPIQEDKIEKSLEKEIGDVE